MAEISKTLVGGLIAVIFSLVIGTVYLYPYYTESDTCTSSRISGPWENITETIYFNETFPAIGRYYCAREAKITKEQCLLQDKLINSDGCKWGGKVGGTTRLYVMVDPEVSISSDSIKSYPLVDVGLQTSEGIKMDWIEDGLTHKCLGFEITKGINTDAVAGLILDTASKDNINPVLSKKSINNWNETKSVIDKCTTVKIGVSVNGTDIMNTTCTYKNVIVPHSDEVWTNVKIDNTEIIAERLDSIKLQDGNYKYCFDVPFANEGNGWGNSGEVKLVIDSNVYTDRQHSSWWNVSIPYRKAIQFDCTSEMCRKYYTARVSGLDTSDSAKFSPDNHNNLEVVCNGAVVDKIIGNKTDITSSGTTKYYPASTGWATINTTFLFRLPQNITSTNSTACYVYYGNLAYNSSASNISNIALLYDDFNRANDTIVGNNWAEGSSESNMGISGNQLICNIAASCTIGKMLDVSTLDDADETEIWTTETIGSNDDMNQIIFNNIPMADPAGNAAPNTIGWARKTSVQYLVVYNMSAGNVYMARKNGVITSSGTYALRFNEMNFGTAGNYLKMFEMYANGVRYSNDDSNSSTGTSGFGEKSFVKIYGNTAAKTIDYIMIKRYMASQPVITLGAEESPVADKVSIGSLNCTNATVYANSFVWNEQIINCQVTCINSSSTPILYTKFTGTEGVSAFDTTDTNDTWFANMTNFTGNEGYYSITITPDFAKANYSGVWNVSVTCSDGTLFNSTSIAWTVANGNGNVTLVNPNVDISRQNGTYILDVQDTACCTGGECFNTSDYLTIGV